jgi:hypothetical protein
MENETTVDFQDETKEEESYEVDESEQSEDTTEEDEVNSTQLQSELEKAKAEIAKLSRLLKKGDKPKGEKSSPQDDSNVVTKADLERIRLEAKGYDEDQVEFLMRFGGAEALKDEAVKSVIDTMKEKKTQAQAQVSGKTQSKSARRYSQEDLQAMPLEKLEKLIKEGKIK